MKKTYCDVCKKEINEANKMPDKGFETTIRIEDMGTVEISVTVDSCPVGVDYCKYCVLESLEILDDGNKVMPLYAPTDFQGEHK